jgi:hypothetical protein
MAVLVDAGAREKLAAIFRTLEERIPEEALRPTAAMMAQDAASRAPSPSQEYNTMMYGGYTAADFNVKNTSKYYGLDDGIFDSDGRIRFYKPDSLYLKNFIPQSYGVNGLNAWIGFIPGLELASGYSYVNVHDRMGWRKGSGQTYEHHVTYPFWQAWEHGGIFTIRPREYENTDPHTHRDSGIMNHLHSLKPFPGNYTLLQMTKVIPAKQMYGAVDPEKFVDSTLIPKIRKIIRSI